MNTLFKCISRLLVTSTSLLLFVNLSSCLLSLPRAPSRLCNSGKVPKMGGDIQPRIDVGESSTPRLPAVTMKTGAARFDRNTAAGLSVRQYA